MKYQGRSKRSKTGGRARRHSKKKKHELGREPTETQLGDDKLRVMDSRGNTRKVRALATDVANVAEGGDTVRAQITDVVDNPSNQNYARRNIITRGAIVETDAGTARVTSRPGQSGRVDAVLVDE